MSHSCADLVGSVLWGSGEEGVVDCALNDARESLLATNISSVDAFADRDAEINEFFCNPNYIFRRK